MNEQTRRELFSAMALQGILASQRAETHRSAEQRGEVVQLARTYADLLIAELTREQVAGGMRRPALGLVLVVTLSVFAFPL